MKSKLEELIEKLCPNGVEWKKIKEVGNVSTGSSNGNEAQENGKFPFFVRSQNIKRKDEWEYDEEAIIIPGEGGIGEVFHYINGKYALHQRVYRINFINNNIKTKFIFYYFKSHFKSFILKKAVSATVISIRKPMIEEFLIPIPPIEVQEEIVRILDKFTELITELATERTLRKQQYEYYRDEILDNNNYSYKKLGELCKFVRGPFGGALKKECFQSEGYVIYEQQHAIYNKFNFRYFISKEKFNELKRFEVYPNDLIISCSGTMGKIAIIPNNIPRGIINQALLKLTANENINVKYLKYCFESTVSKQINSNARGGAIKNVASVDILKKIKIKFPPLEEQQRIVDILDKFDKLVNDIKEGLPAEIEMRQKQYEYYRDKLLNFKKLNAEG